MQASMYSGQSNIENNFDNHLPHCYPDHHHHLYDHQGGEQSGIGEAQCACDCSPPSQVHRHCHRRHSRHRIDGDDVSSVEDDDVG